MGRGLAAGAGAVRRAIEGKLREALRPAVLEVVRPPARLPPALPRRPRGPGAGPVPGSARPTPARRRGADGRVASARGARGEPGRGAGRRDALPGEGGL